VAPRTRVQRSRLAFAAAVTFAALPILVVDNLPASAEKVEASIAPSTTVAPPTTAAPSTLPPTTLAPTTLAPTTVPPTTVAPTTVPPTTTTTRARVAAVRATTTTAVPTTTTSAPAVSNGGADPNDPATWDRLAKCESGGNWAANTGNSYYGGLKFSLSTWQHYGGAGYPHQATKDVQIGIGKKVQAAQGWGAWGGCARSLGYV
jgi:hypothetical protein